MMSALIETAPDWKNRSTVTVAPGRWKMRNGRTVKVKKRIELPYTEAATWEKRIFLVWGGECECCRAFLTWNDNGTHAAIGKHPFDIIGPAE